MARSPLPGLPAGLRALVDAAAALARQAPSSRVAEARAAALLPAIDWPVPAAEPLDRRTVERVLKAAWGSPASRVLDDLDPDPIAVRPAAQVHRGERDGGPVAVKVLRPGLPAAVRADAALLDALAGPLGGAFPRLDVVGVLAEVREAALDELDLEHEATTQRLVGRALRGGPGVVVPGVHGDLAAETVLVTELLPGATLLDGARPADPGAAARALIGACLRAIARTGLAPTDVRPGHVVVMDEGIGLLGLGVARPWPASRLEAALDVLRALRDPDGADALAGVLDDRLGILAGDPARAAHAVAREVLGELLTGPARLDLEAIRAVADRAIRRAAELAGLAAQATPAAADVAALRAIGQLVATLAALEAEEDWVALVLDVAELAGDGSA